MSTFTNDTGSVSIDFTIQFDLTSTPKLKVTDNSTYDTAQTGVNVYVKIKRPDGIVRSPGEGTVDITGDSGSLPVFEYELPLSANDGQVSQGQYQIEYMLTVGSDPTVSKTKSFIYDFNKIKLTTFQDINEFTPLVKVKDITPSYDVTNYNTTSVSRVFVAQNNVNGSNIADQTTTGITTTGAGTPGLTSASAVTITAVDAINIEPGTNEVVKMGGNVDLGTDGATIQHKFSLTASGTTDYIFNDAGSNWFPSAENDPVLYLRRGETYVFQNNSGGSHPFQIRLSNGGAAYNTGVTNNGAAVGLITFTVPMSAPTTLYYQCTNHASMGNTINIV